MDLSSSLSSNSTPAQAINRQLDTEIIIIGNGPAALSLSAFLSGWLPFYRPRKEHPNLAIHQKLMEHIDESLIDQDLTWLDDIVREYGVHGLSILYDSLARPNCDNESLLRWIYDPNRAVPHLLVAASSVGGAWNNYSNETLTVSTSSFLDLPVLSIKNWLKKEKLCSRLPASLICKYFVAYAKIMGLNNRIISNVRITHISKCFGRIPGNEFWEIRGTKFDEPLIFHCRKVVLACGKNQHRKLGIENFFGDMRVVYDISGLSAKLSSFYPDHLINDKVIVIGDGMSAADAVLFCLKANVPVLHVIRRSEQQIKLIQLAHLSPSLYPEYTKIYRLMTGKQSNPLYRKLTNSQIIAFDSNIALLKTPDGLKSENFSIICACIGRCTDLSMLSEEYFFDNYYCLNDQALFRVGSLAGDHFVRYIVGGSLQVAKYLLCTS